MTDLKPEDLVKLREIAEKATGPVNTVGAAFQRDCNMALFLTTMTPEVCLSLLADRARMEKEIEGAERDILEEITTRDAYESAVQRLDLETGGDGEFRVSSDPGRNTPDAVVMCWRISSRFARQVAARTSQDEALLAQIDQAILTLHDGAFSNADVWRKADQARTALKAARQALGASQ